MLKKLLLLSFILITPIQSQNIHDLIYPINLIEGETVTVPICDIFYSEEYPVEFQQNKFVDVKFNPASNEVSFTPNKNFSGMTLVSFKFYDNNYEIPVKLNKTKKYLFTYKPQAGEKQVNLFGQFNSWNRQNLPMKDSDGDGVLEIEIPLDPGRYEYKFFVDGEEIVDPENPVKVPNGMGDFNSVRIIEEEAKDKMFLHILGKEKTANELILKFYFENTDRSNLVSKESIIALFDNQKFPEQLIKVIGREIHLSVKNEMLKGEHSVRIAINRMGKHSNIQTVQIIDGAIAGSNNKRTLHDQIIYSLMIDRFYNGDTTNDSPVVHDSLFKPANYNGGDLAGIIKKIEEGYFDKLGINTLWISPIVDNTNNAYREYPAPHRWYTGYHGYWPVSSTKVEDHFGDMNLARELVEVAHQRRINILLDFVSNHVHMEHPFWKEHRNWFGVLELPDGRKNLRLWDEYRLTTWFEPYMPSFDYIGAYDALEFMTDNAVWWLNVTDADGFRHDAVKHVPNEFWRMLTKKLKRNIELPKKKKIYQIGETFGGIDLIASYVSNGQLNAQFNFNLYDVAIPTFLDEKASFKLVDYQMQKSFQVFGYNNLMGNIMDSHDKIRYMAYADGDLEINDGRAGEIGWTNPPQVDNPGSYKKLKVYMAYLLTIPGIPIIYYGDEIGMTGAADPDNRRMMRFDDELNEFEKQTLEDVSKLIHIRKNYPALRYGDFLTLQADENIYAYIRSDMNERILTVVNKNSKKADVTIAIPSVYKIKQAVDLLTEKIIPVANSKISLVLDGYRYFIFKLE
ncbi:MAG: alpha-glucosidase C-terminal domain-containing protein [Ignavibacterium sp.]|jgi:glycosidase/ribosomal protein L21E|uniref:alpha-amylase family glycosyl hydrolase n=1 Tax=Ignavibacterium sp. TaxID=2651167 RepID=UPI00329700F3